MANLGMMFDATGHEPVSATVYEVLPAGEYLGQAVKSDVRLTKKGDGSYAAIDFEVVDGDHTGRHIFANITLTNPSDKAVDMGQRMLATLCQAAGVLQLSDTEELHFRPVILDVIVKPEETVNGTTYGPRNQIRTFKPASGGLGAPSPAKATGNGRAAEPADFANPNRNGGAAKAGNPTAPWRNRAA